MPRGHGAAVPREDGELVECHTCPASRSSANASESCDDWRFLQCPPGVRSQLNFGVARAIHTVNGSRYVPAEVEERLYEWWEQSGYFKPATNDDKQCFVISMPPPNVTGKLHMGHAMFVALEDIMTRFHRMRGEPTLWLPGTDHAGTSASFTVVMRK